MAQSREEKTRWQRENGRRTREALNAIKMDRGCTKCGYKEHPAALDFNHLDPATKLGNIAEKCGSWSLKKIMDEVEKCEVLCSNCHRIHSYENHPSRVGAA